MKVPYAACVYGQEEILAVTEVLSDPGHIVAGPRVQAFERIIAESFGLSDGLMLNSGSSANLLALATLGLPSGSKILTPALTFGTVVAPIVQLGLWPVFVDVEPGTFVVDAFRVAEAVDREPDIAAFLIPFLLGNWPDTERLANIADARPIIWDCCDTLAVPTHHAFATTTSFYASHVITAAGGGGMACFADPDDARFARLLAYWGRASALDGHGDATEDIDQRYGWAEIEGVPYDAKFLFNASGYNFQPLELQAAFALEQWKRLPDFLERRRRNFALLQGRMERHSHVLALPEPRGEPNWLAYPMVVREGAPFTRAELARYLEAEGVQTRPIMTGNVLRQPGYRGLGDAARFPEADRVMWGGLLVGCHHGLADQEVVLIADAVDEYVEARCGR